MMRIWKAGRARLTLTLIAMLGCCGTSMQPAASESPDANRPRGNAAKPWSVHDAIEMTTIVPLGDPRDGIQDYLTQPWLFSPDAEHFLLLVERGDIERDVVVCELRLFSAKAIRAALTARKSHATDLGATIARAESSTAQDCMEEVRWSNDGERVEFLAEAHDGTRQLFRYRRKDAKVRQVSSLPKGLLNYSASASRYVLSAWEPPDKDGAAVRAPFTVADEWIYTVADPHRSDGGALRYVATYATGEEGDDPIRIDEPTQRRYYTTWEYWISPDGRKAVGLRPPTRIPAHWQRYRAAKDALPLAERPENVHPGVLQFVRVDLVTGKVTPLLDALTGASLQRGDQVEAIWSPTGNSVVLFNTFLPAASTGEAEDNDPAIVEIDVDTGAWSKVRALESQPAGGEGIARSIAWVGEELEILVEITEGSGAAENEGKQATGADKDGEAGNFGGAVKPRRQRAIERYARSGNRWVRRGSIAAGEPRAPGRSIDLRVPQDCNRPPELVARLPGGPSSVVLTDLNPQFAAIDRPRVEVIEWQDAAGRPWKGGLLLPRAAKAGQKVPLVVQYWFQPKYFQPEGATTSAFAASSLASRGIAVLGLADPPGAVDASYSVGGATRAADLYRHGVESGIDHLAGRGLVERDRVGLLGFSRSGYLAKYFLSQSSYPLRAAVVASSTDLGYWQYLTLVGEHAGWVRPGFEQANGGKPFWLDPQGWLQHAPGFNLRNTSAALRLESYSRLEALYQWEHFAAYRILNRPVEMLVIPEGAHNLKKPSHRLLSQQGNVDWFAFWLNGEEDPAPAKGDQYRRWRNLRALVPLNP